MSLTPINRRRCLISALLEASTTNVPTMEH
jgi:hypothetical protein